MNIQFLINEKDYDKLTAHLLRGKFADEEAAILLAGTNHVMGKIRLLVKEIVLVPNEALISKGKAGLTINPEFLSKIIKKCRYEKLSFILTHSHPFSDKQVAFSAIDDYGEKSLFPKIQRRVPNKHHGALVFGKSCVDGRIWLKGESKSTPMDSIIIIGNTLKLISCNKTKSTSNTIIQDEVYNRQILAIKEEGQKLISKVKVGIVGLGGIGSQVFQQLAHLGVTDFILVDFDKIEESNRSRIVGSTIDDVKNRVYKVEITSRLGYSINSKINIKQIIGTVNHLSVATELLGADIIFSCTDTMLSRMVLNRIAFQYMIPLIDMGIDIQPDDDGNIRRISGRVIKVTSNGPCLECMDFVNSNGLSREMNSDNVYGNQYIQNEDVPNPSVISFNGTVSSIGVSEFINFITGCFSRNSQKIFHMYDGRKGIIKQILMEQITQCKICGEVVSIGNNEPLPCILNK